MEDLLALIFSLTRVRFDHECGTVFRQQPLSPAQYSCFRPLNVNLYELRNESALPQRCVIECHPSSCSVTARIHVGDTQVDPGSKSWVERQVGLHPVGEPRLTLEGTYVAVREFGQDQSVVAEVGADVKAARARRAQAPQTAVELDLVETCVKARVVGEINLEPNPATDTCRQPASAIRCLKGPLERAGYHETPA